VLFLFEHALNGEEFFECARHSKYPVTTWLIALAYIIIAGLLLLNMLIAMMAKSYDNGAEVKALNYNFLKAQLVVMAAKQPPAPPPFYLLSIPFDFILRPVLYYFGCERGYDHTVLRCLQPTVKFEKIDTPGPVTEADDTELHNEDLAIMIRKRTVFSIAEFTLDEIVACGVDELQEGNFIKVGNDYFRYVHHTVFVDAADAKRKEVDDAQFFHDYIEQNEDETTRDERWRVLVKKDTSMVNIKMSRFEKQLELLQEAVADLQPSESQAATLQRVEKNLNSDLLTKMNDTLESDRVAKNANSTLLQQMNKKLEHESQASSNLLQQMNRKLEDDSEVNSSLLVQMSEKIESEKTAHSNKLMEISEKLAKLDQLEEADSKRVEQLEKMERRLGDSDTFKGMHADLASRLSLIQERLSAQAEVLERAGLQVGRDVSI